MADLESIRALYHYTTQAGAIGIMEKRSVWATSICYMNDAREFNYARNLLNETLQTFKCEETEEFFEVLRFLRPPAAAAANWDIYPDIFVFALSEHDDRLGLWRAYGGGAAGYAIGFKTPDIKAAGEKEGFRLVKCLYEKHEQQQLIVDLLEEARAWVNGLPKIASALRDYAPVQRFWEAFAVIAASIKHPSFHEEAEWRLVSEGMSIPRPIKGSKDENVRGFVHEPRQVRWRTGPSTLTPFVELPLSSSDGLLPIYRFRAGPCIDPPRAVHAAGRLLYSCGQSAAKGVVPSDIPFRTW